jgi:D-lactate dehydrogenase (cytochrome)
MDSAPQAPSLPPEILTQLQQAAGPGGWTLDAHEIAPHLVEGRGLYHGTCALMVKPATTEAVAAIVRICARHRIPIVPQGGNTGLCGGGVPDGASVLLTTSRMKQLRGIDPATHTMTVEAGMVLADVQRVAAEHGLLFPLSLGAEGSCQIGGNLSTNAGGIAVLRYGNARDLVLGLEVVLPDGEILGSLKSLRKDNTGYDLKQLFIGAEGTLGIITAAVLKLFPLPRDQATGFVAVRDPQAAIELLGLARQRSGDAVTSFELINRLTLEYVLRHMPGTVDPLADPSAWYVLVEMSSSRADAGLTTALEDCLADAIERGLVTDAAIAQSEAQARAMWRLREEAPDAQKFEGGSIKHDVSVPVGKVPEFLARATNSVEAHLPGIRVTAFGHAGDGNIHYNLSQPKGADRDAYIARWAEFNRIVHDIVQDLGGSFSAEHGVGKLKIDELVHYKSPVELATMRAIKRALDPDNIMNPGKVIIP